MCLSSPSVPLKRTRQVHSTAVAVTSTLVPLLLTGAILCWSPAIAVKLPDIYWNSSNPMFRLGNPDHIIDVNRESHQFDVDQVDLICPSYPMGTSPSTMESYIIYLVSRHEYQACALNGSSTSRWPLAQCDSEAGRALKYTITFRSFTPLPGGHEFRPGNEYFLVSTSSGRRQGLMQQRGGACKKHNMRLTFKICCAPSSSSSAPLTLGSSAKSTHGVLRFEDRSDAINEKTDAISTREGHIHLGEQFGLTQRSTVSPSVDRKNCQDQYTCTSKASSISKVSSSVCNLARIALALFLMAIIS